MRRPSDDTPLNGFTNLTKDFYFIPNPLVALGMTRFGFNIYHPLIKNQPILLLRAERLEFVSVLNLFGVTMFKVGRES